MSTVQTGAAIAPRDTRHQALYRKVTLRLITLFCLCYFAAYLDRVNIGLAKLQMLDALKFGDAVYGLGAGLFFVGYVLFEVPSNLILQRVGAKFWIARIMITWGVLSGATMWVHTPMQFYVVRFLLGVAEAGFLPGVLLYLTQWYPDARRARIVALFMVGLPMSSMIGSPISGWIMRFFDGVHGLGGWQWLFLLEALPSVLLGFAVLRWLPNTIESAKWLSDEEKRILRVQLSDEEAGHKSHALRDAFANWRVWSLGVIDLCVLLGLYAVSFWLPTILRDTGVTDSYHIGWLMVIPNAVAVLATLLCGSSSDRARERRWHIVVPFAVAAGALVVAGATTPNTVMTVLLFSLVNAGAAAAMPVVWALPSTFLRGTAAAGGIAFACSIANVGGFGSTYLIGYLRETFRSQSAGLYAFAGFILLGCLLALAYPKALVNR